MAEPAPIAAVAPDKHGLDGRPSRPLVGAAWMLATGICFIAVTAIVKHVGSAVPAAQAGFLRFALGLVFLIPVLPALMRLRLDRGTAVYFGGRGFIHAFGTLFWFLAITLIPIAEVTAINYLTPVFVMLGAALLLGERLAARRLIAAGVAILGILIVLRPGFREISPGHLSMLLATLFFAGSFVMAKRMTASASPGVVVGLLSICVTITLAPFAWAVWVPIGLEAVGWLFLTACVATLGHYTMTMAFAAAPVSVTQPIAFLQLVWSVILGVLIFAEPIDLWVIVGGTVIVAAVSYITWREAVRRKAAPPG